MYRTSFYPRNLHNFASYFCVSPSRWLFSLQRTCVVVEVEWCVRRPWNCLCCRRKKSVRSTTSQHHSSRRSKAQHRSFVFLGLCSFFHSGVYKCPQSSPSLTPFCRCAFRSLSLALSDWVSLPCMHRATMSHWKSNVNTPTASFVQLRSLLFLFEYSCSRQEEAPLSCLAFLDYWNQENIQWIHSCTMSHSIFSVSRLLSFKHLS